ncbi:MULTISPECIES: replication endonuclease [Marinobacter]|uniref:replication endonuclease n=1 Tax=Marinobacter TaxID=2742 RepID=UPI0012449502|nr:MULTISPECIES: replication endonuclease [Marinobacter]MBL3556873.1 replication endonuclease [Marinobacter sp. JB05H06]
MTPSDPKQFRFYRTKGRLYTIGTRQTRVAVTRFRKRFHQVFPKLEPHLYLIGQDKGCIALEIALEDLESKLQRRDLKFTIDDAQVIDFARSRAKVCYETSARITNTAHALKAIGQLLARYSFDLPKSQTDKGCIERTKDEIWWRRLIRKEQKRVLDNVAREYGLVSKKKGVYVSDWGLRLHQEQLTRNRSLLEEMIAVNDQCQEYTLAELSALSVSNPYVRRSELIVRASGFEKIAQDLGHAGIFLTLTTPSKYHPVKVSGQPNPKYNGSTPGDAQAYLNSVWSRIRAQLDREEIRTYGLRIVEPHHDGTPHWHLMLFVEPAHKARLVEIMRTYALLEDGDEKGAKEARFDAVDIDYDRGSATGYIVKYICKNIDGEFQENGEDAEDWYGNLTKDVAARVRAWASIHGIRQFQQIGGPPVTVWRELRRLDHADDEIVEKARQAADKSDWAGFIEAMNGPSAKRADQPIKTAKWLEFDQETGECLDSPVNQYGEPAKGKLFGIYAQGQYWITRALRWEIKRPKKAEPKVSSDRSWLERLKQLTQFREATEAEIAALPDDTAYTWEKLSAEVHPPPWSSVNNCTWATGEL